MNSTTVIFSLQMIILVGGRRCSSHGERNGSLAYISSLPCEIPNSKHPACRPPAGEAGQAGKFQINLKFQNFPLEFAILNIGI